MTSKFRAGDTVLGAIGSTPLIQVDGIFVKLEYLNPSGSIKARMARYIIERAEREGLLHPGDTIVEASSGNTGNAMSMVAAVLGYLRARFTDRPAWVATDQDVQQIREDKRS